MTLRIRAGSASLVFILLFLSGCAADVPVAPDLFASAEQAPAALGKKGPDSQACWGQATKVFARMGEMGEHASEFPTPRIGLRNLARALFEADVIEEDTMQALGQFVAAELGLEIDACL